MQARQYALGGENHHRLASDCNCGVQRKTRATTASVAAQMLPFRRKDGGVVPSPAHGCCDPAEGSHPRTPPFQTSSGAEGRRSERRELLLFRRVRLGQFAWPLPSGLCPPARAPEGGQAPPGNHVLSRSLGLCTLRKPRRQDLRAGLVPMPSPLPGRRQHPGDPHPSRPFRPLTPSPPPPQAL